jgi:transcriptional regulator with XRE-family HTH domain
MEADDVGRMVRQARRRAGLTQVELAQASGMAQSAVARIERGTVTPRASTLIELLGATGHELAVRPIIGAGATPARNEALQRLETLVGDWKLTLTDAWFLESPDVEQYGQASVAWLGDAFLHLRGELGEEHSTWDWVFGRSDATEQLTVLYHDDRGVCRVFAMTFEPDGEWTMTREDPDFHQRFIGTVGADRIDGRWEASEDAGATWRKDFDLIFERVQ